MLGSNPLRETLSAGSDPRLETLMKELRASGYSSMILQLQQPTLRVSSNDKQFDAVIRPGYLDILGDAVQYEDAWELITEIMLSGSGY